MLSANPKYLRRADAAEYLKRTYGFGSARTLAKLASTGGGPAFVKIGACACYEIAALDAWVSARTVHKLATSVDAPVGVAA